MMRALFAGVSGLRNHQTRMDVIGNNIANVNTVGFKSSRVTFKEAFVQLVTGATRPLNSLGGLNPMQIGTGMNVGSIDQLFTQGALETTGQPLDMAIQGGDLFVLSDGNGQYYTRAGNFQIDASGNLVAGTSGKIVQGLTADASGNLTASTGIGNIQLNLGNKAPAQATTQVTLTGNLDVNAAIGDQHTMSIRVYDSTGSAHNLQMVFTNTGPGAWSWAPSSSTAPVTPAGSGTATFNPDGSLATFTYPGGGANITLTPAAGAPFTVTINPGTVGGINGLSGFANPSNAVINSQNGFAAGDLVSISVDTHGIINGFFTNGVTRSLAQVALATFNNASGLSRNGDNLYTESANSGTAVIGFSGGTSSSVVTPSALESSNVDISTEFTDMIITQRGFQANAKVITTADEMLNDIVNLRR
jgi:flagellar hook protein FlgE